jgi:hypothetical protein
MTYCVFWLMYSRISSKVQCFTHAKVLRLDDRKWPHISNIGSLCARYGQLLIRWESDHNPKRREYVDEDKGVRRNLIEAPQQWVQGVEKANEESEESTSQNRRPNESEPS